MSRLLDLMKPFIDYHYKDTDLQPRYAHNGVAQIAVTIYNDVRKADTTMQFIFDNDVVQAVFDAADDNDKSGVVERVGNYLADQIAKSKHAYDVKTFNKKFHVGSEALDE